MRKVAYKLFKEKVWISIGLVIGVILMGGASYAVDNLSSESVSYIKKDGTITTVKNALDDLISKVPLYLADVVKVGDYVDYDAGVWSQTTVIPTKNGDFGGYSKGQSKNDSVSVCNSDRGSTNLKGWRVLSKDEKTKTVTIVHAGQPECYYHAGSNAPDLNASINNLNSQANQYVNSYAKSAHAMTRDEAFIDPNIRTIGSYYYLTSTMYRSDLQHDCLLYITPTGTSAESNIVDIGSFGFRPVVVLKDKILTTGEGLDQFNQKAWLLVKPKN